MDLNLTVRQYRGRNGFAEISEAWQELMKTVSTQCFYHHPSWFMAYFDRPDIRDDMYFRCAYADGRLVAVLPVYFRSRLGGMIREARLPDYDGLYMPDMVVSDGMCLLSIWQELSRPSNQDVGPRWDVFSAESVLETSTIARCLASATGDLVTSSKSGECAILDVLPYDEFLRQLKRKFRGNLNNAKHRLSNESGVEFAAAQEADDLNLAFEEFVELELSGWKGKPDKVRRSYPPPAAIGLKRSKYLFYRNVVREFGAHRSVKIFMLKLRGRLIAAQICVFLNEICYILKTAFDEKYSKFSPGHLVLDFVYREVSSAGVIKQICMISDYGWFRYWGPDYKYYLRMKSFANNLKGKCVSIAYSVRR